MFPKPALTIVEQLQKLKDNGMFFEDEAEATKLLQNISYYRLKGYWWDMQADRETHQFKPDTSFGNVIRNYTFDRRLRLILLDAIERIEVSLRTKMIYHMSLANGGLWYENEDLFINRDHYNRALAKMDSNIQRSNEIFIKDHQNRYGDVRPEAWKAFEVLSFGELSKIYKNIQGHLPEKSTIAQEMGITSSKTLGSWLESFAYIRNIVAHHSRLIGRTMVRKPSKLVNPMSDWLNMPIRPYPLKMPFHIISAMLYVANQVTPGHSIKIKLKDLLLEDSEIPIHSLGFTNGWQDNDLWK